MTARERGEPSPNPDTRRPVVIAVTADDDRYAETRRAGMEVATARSCCSRARVVVVPAGQET